MLLSLGAERQPNAGRRSATRTGPSTRSASDRMVAFLVA